MIIDCHGHYTTAPAAHTAWRESQIAAWEAGVSPPRYPESGDDEIRETIEGSQLRLMDERGIGVTVFSPRASAMAHHVGDARVSLEWGRRCNDLVHRVTTLFPDRFIGVAQLPQSPGAGIEGSIAELRRCVEELGFVGCNLNPDPSGGSWTSPPLTDRSWYPFYEAMVELDVPAMVHVSASATKVFHATGAYYINADTTGCSARRWWARYGASTPGPGTTSTTPPGTSTPPDWRTRPARRCSSTTSAGSTRAWTARCVVVVLDVGAVASAKVVCGRPW